jgi:hypothetical protein
MTRSAKLGGPSYKHYRNYRCLITETDSIRTSDNIILYPAPLVLPGASRDKLLALTEELTQLGARTAAPTDPDSQELHRYCLQRLKTFLTTDTPNNPTAPAEPITCSTRTNLSAPAASSVLTLTSMTTASYGTSFSTPLPENPTMNP